MHSLCVAALVIATPLGTSNPPPFRTEIAPRIDPVFGDSASLRHSLDRFLVLDAEMRQVADQFSTAVHDTLAELARSEEASRMGNPNPPDRTGKPTPTGAAPDRTNVRNQGSTHPLSKTSPCRPAMSAAYERARAAGTHYIALGRELDVRMHDIRLADSYGDAMGLTPDYRLKVERARRDHAERLHVLREMLVAFHDQLQTELRYAGCDVADLATDATASLDGDADEHPGDADQESDVSGAPAPAAGSRPPLATGAAPVVAIVIDSSHCPEQSTLTVDGNPLGRIEGGRRTLVRVAEGPHAFCVLPLSDRRTCAQDDAIRHAYAHDGWVLEVRCER